MQSRSGGVADGNTEANERDRRRFKNEVRDGKEGRENMQKEIEMFQEVLLVEKLRITEVEKILRDKMEMMEILKKGLERHEKGKYQS